jgi:ornithine decarboxylase
MEEISEAVNTAPGVNALQAGVWTRLAKRHGTPLLVLNVRQVRLQYQRLSDALPGVQLYYAVKAFPHPAVITTLAELGCNFDLASSGEVQLMRDARVEAGRCLHTHPIKSDREIRAALAFGCTTFVADNPVEIRKLAPYRNKLNILLRVSFPNPGARCDLSKKFGCAPADVGSLLELAASLKLKVTGMSFHAGSQVPGPEMHVHAINQCIQLLETYREWGKGSLRTLDIGGGFPADYDGQGPDIDDFCKPMREALAGLPTDIRVIAEPGRFLVAAAATALASVIGCAERGGKPWYYLDDGIFGSYNGIVTENARYPLVPLSGEGELRSSVLAGPTCDSFDVLTEDLQLPTLKVGDLVAGLFMGAYTYSTATNFNGLPTARVLVQGLSDLARRKVSGARSR